MDNKITFTGIKNISYCFDNRKFRRIGDFLSAELTGKDFHKFKKAVARSGFDFDIYEHPYQKNFINISTVDLDEGNIRVLFINDVPVEEIDESIPLFQFAARLTRRIAKKKAENFLLEKDYSNSCLFDKVTLLGETLKDPDRYHIPQMVKDGAKNINRFVQNIMMDYFR